MLLAKASYLAEPRGNMERLHKCVNTERHGSLGTNVIITTSTIWLILESCSALILSPISDHWTPAIFSELVPLAPFSIPTTEATDNL